jgi:uncharacterized BrkB/YihY/UPF0761 family membrane protein
MATGERPLATARFERFRRLEARLRAAPASRPALEAIARDRRLGGPLLAGALAFRLFAVLLPLALLLTVALGYAATVDDASPKRIGQAVGIGETALASVAQSAKLDADKRWFVLAATIVALVYAAVKAGRAVWAIHGLAWTGQAERAAHPLRVGLGLLGVVAALAVVWGVSGLGRAELGDGGLVVPVLAIVPFFGIWLLAARALPHADAPLRALVPGAALVAVGLQVVHLGTVLVAAKQIQRASDTYGPLGAAFTILVWLFVISRVIIASAMLGAALWQRRPR